jgi:hypothetical protein
MRGQHWASLAHGFGSNLAPNQGSGAFATSSMATRTRATVRSSLSVTSKRQLFAGSINYVASNSSPLVADLYRRPRGVLPHRNQHQLWPREQAIVVGPQLHFAAARLFPAKPSMLKGQLSMRREGPKVGKAGHFGRRPLGTAHDWMSVSPTHSEDFV